LSIQRPHIPGEVRPVFVPAALAGFAGFAVLGLFTAVAPGFLGQILGIASPAAAGLAVFAIFAASTVGQTLLAGIAGRRALLAGSAGLVAGMLLLGLGLALSSLELLVAGGVVAGLGQGVSFVTGLRRSTPPPRRSIAARSRPRSSS
jgi:MFS family permease